MEITLLNVSNNEGILWNYFKEITQKLIQCFKHGDNSDDNIDLLSSSNSL